MITKLRLKILKYDVYIRYNFFFFLNQISQSRNKSRYNNSEQLGETVILSTITVKEK